MIADFYAPKAYDTEDVLAALDLYGDEIRFVPPLGVWATHDGDGRWRPLLPSGLFSLVRDIIRAFISCAPTEPDKARARALLELATVEEIIQQAKKRLTAPLGFFDPCRDSALFVGARTRKAQLYASTVLAGAR